MKRAMRLLATMAVLALLARLGAAQVWTIEVKTNGTHITATELDVAKKIGKAAPITGVATVQVTCDASTDCTKVVLQLVQAGKSETVKGPKNSQATAVSLTKAAVTGADAQLEILYDGTSLAKYPIAGDDSSNPPGAVQRKLDLASMLANPCAGNWSASYDPKNNRGSIVVTVQGDVLARPTAPFDEDDVVEVHVVVDPRLANIRVTRKSAFRQVREVRVVGEEVQESIRFGNELKWPRCEERTFTLADFEPGRGEVEISLAEPAQVMGSFDFQVDPLYTGAFSLAAVWTKQTEPGYVLVSSGEKKVVAVGDAGDRDLVYSVLFTPYLWGKRDLQKPLQHWYERVNPTLGLALNNTSDHGFIGLSVDLPGGIAAIIGEHFRRVSTLAKESGLVPGAEFTGGADELPLVKRWDHDRFVAISIDLRVAINLIRLATSK